MGFLLKLLRWLVEKLMEFFGLAQFLKKAFLASPILKK